MVTISGTAPSDSKAQKCVPILPKPVCTYDAFGVFGFALHEKIGVFHPSSLEVVQKTPKAL
jgi:hypothetical protein